MQVFTMKKISGSLVFAGLLSVSMSALAEDLQVPSAIITAPVVVTGTRVE